MGKQWVRQQVKRDELGDAVNRGIDWVRDNRQTAGIGAAVTAALLLAGGIAFYSHRARQAEAWDKLSMAQGLAYSGFADRAIKEIEAVSAAAPGGRAEAYAQLFAADVLYYQTGRYAEAQKAYRGILERGEPKPLQPLALAGLGIAQEAAGQYQEALASHQRFMDQYPEHFLAPEAHSSLARSLAALGRSEEAKAALQKIALQYPDTPWAAQAQRRIAGK